MNTIVKWYPSSNHDPSNIDISNTYMFVQELLPKGEKKLAQYFNCTFRYIDDVLMPNRKNFNNLFTPNISSRTRRQRYNRFS